MSNPLRPWRGLTLYGISVLVLLTTLSGAGRAEWKGYFDVTGVTLPMLAPSDWTSRADGQRLTFLCTAPARCPIPTAIEVKGVLRTEDFPAAFRRGPMSPEELAQQGEINARRLGSRFGGAVAVHLGGIHGVQMEASAGPEGKTVHYLTTWVGRGDRLLDVKITSPDLAVAQKLRGEVIEALVLQVFK